MRKVILVLIFQLGATPSVLAYETDVHYGLTKWLALVAGFESNDAEQIATANQDLDRHAPAKGPRRDAIHVVLSEIILGRTDDQIALGSKQVQIDHFRSSNGNRGSAATGIEGQFFTL